MDSAFRYMKNNGYDAVKTGYVGRIIHVVNGMMVSGW
jgi:hypothetical protein